MARVVLSLGAVSHNGRHDTLTLVRIVVMMQHTQHLFGEELVADATELFENLGILLPPIAEIDGGRPT